MVHVRLERLFQADAHHPLRGLHGQRRVGGDLGRHLASGRHQLVVLDDLVDQPQRQRLFGAQHLAPEGDLGRLGPADEAGQQPGAAAFRQHAALAEDSGQLRRVEEMRMSQPSARSMP